MFTSIFILILLLPAVCLPLALKTFFSSTDLRKMGVCLKKSEDAHAMSLSEYELVCIPINQTVVKMLVACRRSAKDFKLVSKLSI